jgi:Flp pilus assembly protein TadG
MMEPFPGHLKRIDSVTFRQRPGITLVRSLFRQREGTAAVELALIAPMLLILLVGIIDFGRVYRDEIELSAVVASAAQYALVNSSSVNSTNASGLAATLSGIVANGNGAGWAGATATVNNGATNSVAANGTTTASGTAANANSCWCPTGGSASWGWGSVAACGSTCSGGTLAGKFVTIAGTRSFAPIFSRYGLIGSSTLHQSTIVQSQ